MNNTRRAKLKRLLGLLLVLAMVLGAVPSMGITVRAYTGSGTKSSPYVVTTYAELQELMKGISSGTVRYIRLGKDITVTAGTDVEYCLSLTTAKRGVDLDLNGYTITCNKGAFHLSAGSLTIRDSSSGGTGRILSKAGDTVTIEGSAGITVEGGTLEAGGGRVLYSKPGEDKISMVINGGTFISGSGGSNVLACLGGEVIINDGTFQSEAEAALMHNVSNTVIINGGIFDSKISEVMYNYKNTVTIDGGLFESGDEYVLMCNDSNTATIDGGVFQSETGDAVQARGTFTLTINDGTFQSGKKAAVDIILEGDKYDKNHMEINGGTFKSQNEALLMQYRDSRPSCYRTGKITGGTFVSKKSKALDIRCDYHYFYIIGGEFSTESGGIAMYIGKGADVIKCTAKGNIRSGTGDIWDVISKDSILVLDGKTAPVRGAEAFQFGTKAKEKIEIIPDGDGTKENPFIVGGNYMHLLDLMRSAPTDGSTRYIKLVADIESESDQESRSLCLAENNQKVDLDLNGLTISRTPPKKYNYGAVQLDKGQLTIRDSSGGSGKITSDNLFYSIQVRDSGLLIINSGTFDSSEGYALGVNGGTVRINGGTFHSSEEDVLGIAGGTLTVNGGIFYSSEKNALRTIGGTLTVNGGTFRSDEMYGAAFSGGKIVINGGNFVTESGGRGGVVYHNGTVTVNDGSFYNYRTLNTRKGRYGICIELDDYARPDFTINTCSTLGGIYYGDYFFSKYYENWFIELVASGSEVVATDAKGTESVIASDLTADERKNALEEAYLLEISRRISKVTITGIDTPKIGKHPDMTAALKVSGADIKEVTWYDWNTNREITSGDVFEDGHTYMVMVKLSARSGYVFATPGSKLNVSINGEKGFLWMSGRRAVQCCLNFTVAEEPLSGTITLSGAYYNKTLAPNFSDNLQQLSEDGELAYQWQRAGSEGGPWSDIGGAVKKNYTCGKEDVNKYIRLKVTGSSPGFVASNAVQVGKSPVNSTKPENFEVLQRYRTQLLVVYTKAAQEYLVTYSATAPEKDSEEWENAKSPSADGGTVQFGCEENRYVYVHTRVKESEYSAAGTYTITHGIYTGETASVKIQAIEFNYTHLDMKVGDVVKLTAGPVPSNAGGWSGANWYINEEGAELYLEESCTTRYYSSVHGYRTELYLKATRKTNRITVAAERSTGYNEIARGVISVNVTDRDGNYALDEMLFPEVTLAPGENTTVDISTSPSPASIDGELTFVRSDNTPESIRVTGNAEAKTVTITVPVGTANGEYSYRAKVNGEDTYIISVLHVNVVDSQKQIPAESISVQPEKVTLAPGQSYRFRAVVKPSNASGTLKWSRVKGSTNLSIDSTGNVKVSAAAKGGDTATFRAEYGGKSATFTVTAATPVESVRLKQTGPEAGKLPSAPECTATDGVDTGSMTCAWYSTWGTYEKMDMSADRFEAGKSYRLCVEVDARDGYIFTSSVIPKITVGGGSYNGVVSSNTVTRLGFYLDFTVPDNKTGVTVSGKVYSAGSKTEDVTIRFIKKGGSSGKAAEVIVQGNSADYSISGVTAGTYTMKVMKKNHVTRAYTITVGTKNVTKNVKIHLPGDIDGNGKITIADVNRANLHYKKKAALEGYELLCADVTGDGTITLDDVTRMNLHYKKKSLLW